MFKATYLLKDNNLSWENIVTTSQWSVSNKKESSSFKDLTTPVLQNSHLKFLENETNYSFLLSDFVIASQRLPN